MNWGRWYAMVVHWLSQGENYRRRVDEQLQDKEPRLAARGQRQKKRITDLIFLSALLVLLIDYLTSSVIHFPLTFFLPIALITWWDGRRQGVILTGLMMLAQVGYTLAYATLFAAWLWAILLNGLVTITILLLFVYLVDHVVVTHLLLAKQAAVAPLAAPRLKVLHGILPICSFCKRIRNEAEEWEQIEEYITRHSEAQFSHGLCPDCLQQYYGDLRKQG